MDKLKTINIPHAVKVAAFLIVSGALATLINGLGQLNLSPVMLLVVSGVLNQLLAMVTKYYETHVVSSSVVTQVETTQTAASTSQTTPAI